MQQDATGRGGARKGFCKLFRRSSQFASPGALFKCIEGTCVKLSVDRPKEGHCLARCLASVTGAPAQTGLQRAFQPKGMSESEVKKSTLTGMGIHATTKTKPH